MFKNRPRIIIEKSETDRVIDLVCLLVAALHILYVAMSYSDLPETIATHFNAAGEADGWGSKSFIWLLPGISLIMYVGLSILIKYPHVYNYLVEITKENAEIQYRIAIQLIRYLNLVVLILFFYISYLSITSSSGSEPAIGSQYIIPIIIAVMFIFIASLLVKSVKMK